MNKEKKKHNKTEEAAELLARIVFEQTTLEYKNKDKINEDRILQNK